MDKKIIEKLNNKDFAKKILNFQTKEEVKKAFEEEGIEVTEKDVDDLGEMIVNMISKISEMSEEELQKISAGGPLFNAYNFFPYEVSNFIYKNTPLSEEKTRDFVFLPLLALECIAVWEGGKWLYKKGKNSWLPKLKEKLSKKKD